MVLLSSRPFRRLAAVAALLLVAAVGAGPLTAAGATTPTTHHTFTVQVGSQAEHMALQGMRFLPGDVTVDVGDSVRWVVRSAEIHTVTFFHGGQPQTMLPDFDPSNANGDLVQIGGNVIDGSDTLLSSGLMTDVPTGGDAGPLPPVPHVQAYTLRFTQPGTYTYYCWVHEMMMVGVVHVQPQGTAYPYTQAQYGDQAAIERAGLRAIGNHLWRQLRADSTNHRVFLGADNGQVMVMRFVRHTVLVHVGQTVHFLNTGMGAPHTVTFGNEPPPPALFGPSGDPTHFAGGDLNSGIVGPGGRFDVTFTKAGVYRYVCALHDGMGMRGSVVVMP